MSALGQKQTFAVQNVMSALRPRADICSAQAHVCFVPKADIALASSSSSGTFVLLMGLIRNAERCAMSRTGTSVLGRNADEIDWRQIWLTTAMIDSGKLEPSKIARYKMQPRKDSLTRRLHRLRRMREVLGPR
jgi:hypothetical protein